MDQKQAWTVPSLFNSNPGSVRNLQSQQSSGNLIDRPGWGANSFAGGKCAQAREELTSVHKVLPSLLFSELRGVII
jgi:hypothetical protein